jgi:hypothetical protein
MNPRIILCVWFIVPMMAMGQDNFYTIKEPDRHGISLQVTTSVSGNLYAGVDNYIRVQSRDIPLSEVHVKADQGIFLPDDSLFYCMPSRPGRFLVHVYRASTDTTLLFTQRVPVSSLPLPALRVGRSEIRDEQEIPLAEILLADSIGIVFTPDIPGSDRWIQIQAFTVGYFSADKDIQTTNPGPVFHPKTRDVIKKIRPGQQVYFRIQAGEEGEIRQELPVFRVKVY